MRILINGAEVIVPASLGIGDKYVASPYYDPQYQSTIVHTHLEGPSVSWETSRNASRLEDLYLGALFEIWGKTFNSKCVFKNCVGGGKTLNMTVNGKANTDFEKYLVHDGDAIIIRFQ